jgi:septal ring factor EnvC (AmiA/AmiB activator)
MNRSFHSGRIASIGALALLTAVIAAGPSRGDLASRYAAGQERAGRLRSAIQADTSRIQGYQGTVASLERRLGVIQRSVVVQERLLADARSELFGARARLQRLESQYAHDRQVLAAELLAEYESPPPTVVGVIVDSHGFDDLLNGLSYLRSIERQNAQATSLVKGQRLAVKAQAHRLAAVQARRQRATAAVLVERDQVVQLRLSIVNRELVTAHVRARSTSQLDSLRRTLAHETVLLDQRAAAAQAASSGGAGTDYTVGQEPIIAARLDALGRALQLQLSGISGYRSPQHSVEVGGFADDPHTRGEASDTPGVEGVPEATLEQYCLTRPFPGPREADHIQES